jgi:hypothetical protein
MINMEILKKGGGVVEKRGEEETKSMPHAPVVAGTFVCYILYQEELLGAQNIYLHQAELLDGQSLINNRLTLNIISTNIIQLEIMQAGQLSADTICTKLI